MAVHEHPVHHHRTVRGPAPPSLPARRDRGERLPCRRGRRRRPGVAVGHHIVRRGLRRLRLRRDRVGDAGARRRQRRHARCPPGCRGWRVGLVNAARQVGTSVGLAVLGTIGVHAATTSWATRSTGVPGAAGQAQYVAGGQITTVTHALGAQYRSDAVAAFVSGYHLALIVAAVATLAGGGRGCGGTSFRGRRRRPAPAGAAASRGRGGRRGPDVPGPARRPSAGKRDAAQDAQAAAGSVVGELARVKGGAVQLVGRAAAVRRVGEHVVDGEPTPEGHVRRPAPEVRPAGSSPCPPSMKQKASGRSQRAAKVGESPTMPTTDDSSPARVMVRRQCGNVSRRPISGSTRSGSWYCHPGWFSSEPRWWSMERSAAPVASAAAPRYTVDFPHQAPISTKVVGCGRR